MKHYFCSCCDKVFGFNSGFWAIRDGNRLLLLHEECILVFSGGLGLKCVEADCSVAVENYVEVDESGDVRWRMTESRAKHREDGPAVEWADGDKFWYIDGLLHREDGPACVWADGGKSWYKKGKRHREDGPALEFGSGTKFWLINDEFHREEGPAVERPDGRKEWYLNGLKFTEEEHTTEMKRRGSR